MHTEPMFLDRPETLFQKEQEKYAGMLTPLGDNADQWPQEITQEAYKALPFLSDFAVNVVVDKIDEEHGYALGSIEVQPQSVMTPQEMQQRPVKTIQIPFVVRDKMLAPLDLYIDNKHYHHLTEGRLRAALFRPDVFDATRDRPAEPTLYADLQPPLDSTSGFGGGGVKLGAYVPVAEIKKGLQAAKKPAAQAADAAKTFFSKSQQPLKKATEIRGALPKYASVLPILPLLRDRAEPAHVDRLKTAMKDPSIRMAYANAPEGVKAAMASALLITPSDPRKTAAAVEAELVAPNVVQFRKLASGRYQLKYANSDMYQPQSQEVSPEEVQMMLGDPSQMPQLENDGTLTASPDTVVKQTLQTEEVRNIDQPGIWLVQDSTGNTLTGWAFPQLLSLKLVPLPLILFTNGSQFALQGEVAGRLVGKTADLPRGVMQGYGCLYYLDHGTPRVFEPMTIKSSYQDPSQGTSFMATSDTGEEVCFSFAPGLKNPAPMGPNNWCLPDFFKWMPLRGRTELVEEPLLFTKVAAEQKGLQGELIGEGGVYTFRGTPFSKLAAREHQFLTRDQTVFVGAAAGIDPSLFKEAFARCEKGEVVKFAGLRQIGSPYEAVQASKTKIAKALNELPRPIRNYFLVKEAAVLDDALTADKILGLGFLNPENVATFVDLLPGLEYASDKIAEMLFASRVGLKDLPEVALERMLCALEDVIQGLRALKQKDTSFTGSNQPVV